MKIGSLVIIKAGAAGLETALVGQTEMSFSSSADAIETSNKLSGTYAEFEYGRIKQTVSVSGIAGTTPEDTLKGYYELLAYQQAKTKVSVVFAEYTDNTAANVATGVKVVRSVTCLIGKLDTNFPDNKENKFSLELTISQGAQVFENPAILAYSIPSQAIDAVVNPDAHTIAVTMPNGTNVSALVATFTLADGCTVKVSTTSQVSGVTANNFTSPVVYIVKAADGITTVNWTVTVTVL